jgi:hypothetical protein
LAWASASRSRKNNKKKRRRALAFAEMLAATPTPSFRPSVFALGADQGPTFADIESELNYAPAVATPTPSPGIILPTLNAATYPVGMEQKMPAGCPCVPLAQEIYSRFLLFVQRLNVFDNPVTGSKGRVTQALDVVSASSVGPYLEKPSSTSPFSIQELRAALKTQSEVNRKNIASLLSKTAPPSFVLTNDRSLRVYAHSENPKNDCQARDWADAMNEIFYVSNKTLADNANAIKAMLASKLAATKSKCGDSKSSCEFDVQCELKVRRFYQSDVCSIKPTYEDDISHVMVEVENLLTPTLREREDLFAWAKQQFVTEYTAAKSNAGAGQSSVCYNGCSQFGLELASQIWQAKAVASPRLVQIPKSTPAEFARLPASVQRAYVYVETAHDTDSQALQQYPCNIPLISSYIFYLWAAIELLNRSM